MIPWELGDTVRQGRNLCERIVASKSTWNGNTPQGVSYVWQTLGLETPVFGSVAILGLTGEFSDVWQRKELGDPSATLRTSRGQETGVRPDNESRERHEWSLALRVSVRTNTGENSMAGVKRQELCCGCVT